MRILLQDLRYGLRMLAKDPGFTAVAIVTIALGIGANTAIFSLIDAVLLRALPVRAPEELVVLQWSANSYPGIHGMISSADCRPSPGLGVASGCSFSYPFFNEIHSQTNLLSGITAFHDGGQLALTGSGPATMISAEYVSGDYFSMLGIGAAAGRTIIPADDTPSASPVAVLNYAYWQRALGGESSAVGKSVRLNSTPITIVGVAESRFTSLTPGRVHDFWVPLSLASRLKGLPNGQSDAGFWWLTIVGRLRPGVLLSGAQAAVNVAFRDEVLHRDQPMLKDPAIQLIPITQGLVGWRARFSDALYLLMFAVSIILLIACANVGGLMLARATARQKEVAVRMAVGASRRRIMRQLLTESVLLALLGGGFGIVMASWSASAILAFLASSFQQPPGFTSHVDARILAFTAAVSILTGILFGIAPALRGTRLDLTPALKECVGGFIQASPVPRNRLGLGNGLVGAQVALAMVVLAGAGLLVHTLVNLESINPGFDSRNILLFGINPTLGGYEGARLDNFYRDLQDQVAVIPGVTSASYSEWPLLSSSVGKMSMGFRRPGSSEKIELGTDWLAVGPQFFETMRLPLLTGRNFRPADFAAATSVKSSANPPLVPTPVIVNQMFVGQYLSGLNPLGRRFGQSDGSGGEHPSAGYEIIGVVRDAKYDDLKREISPTTYAPLSGSGATFELRTLRSPQSLIPEVRNVVSRFDRNLPLFDIKTQSEQIDQMLFKERLIARLSSCFGLLALLLACVGLYGLLSYEVGRRTREIGIRIALGGRRADVLRLVIKGGLRMTLGGVAIGIVAAMGLTRLLASFLFGVKPTDPLTFAAVTALLCAIALVACYIPARRATKVDPMVALRYE